jgi:GNAT superfamily N-acetyltransferase
MEIVDITDNEVPTYCKCLEDWSHEFDDEGGRKFAWYGKMKERGLRVKLAREEDGRVVGMIQYAPAEAAPVDGAGIHYVYCVWVHGYEEGVGKQQGRGIGKALLAAAEADAKASGSKGLAAWGLRLPFFMRSSWFKRQGYKVVDREGMMELVFKPFVEGAAPPRFLERRDRPAAGASRVTVTAYTNGWCPAQNIVYERAQRASAGFPGAVDFVGVDTSDKAALAAHGIPDGLFIDGKEVRTGPPPSYEKVRSLIERQVRKRRLGGRVSGGPA